MKHSHHHCQHAVDYCSHCDTAYCTKCDAEWKPPCRQLHYPLFGSLTYYPWASGGGYGTIGHATGNLGGSVAGTEAPPELVTVCAHGR